VRDLPRTRFPRIKGRLLDDFKRQVETLRARYEMATLESALRFLDGRYEPARDLCLLTFDDGVKEHFTDVSPWLAERRIQGLFFVITSSLEEHRVVSVHKSHFLMAALDFEEYRAAFLRQLKQVSPETPTDVDLAKARHTYRWDPPEVGVFRYLVNFGLAANLRDRILDALFCEYLGPESAFARELYVNWDEARQMQAAGMVLGGHSHSHVPLATLAPEAQRRELEVCARWLWKRLQPQPCWPFTYPYGQSYAFNDWTSQTLRELGFICAFTTEMGANAPGQDRFALHRVDTNDVSL
jgi:peptidoglycan/xylan/chitin deacetylase (PgdA/CDA1 family)